MPTDPLYFAALSSASVAITQILKGFGLPSKVAGTTAMLLGVLLYTVGTMYPQVNVLLIGLAGAGVYTLAQKVGSD